MNSNLWGGALLIAAILVLALTPPPVDPTLQLDPAASAYRPPGAVLYPIALANGRTLLVDRLQAEPEGLSYLRLGQEGFVPWEEVIEPPRGSRPEPRRFFLGSDKFGRDVWSRIMVGGRVSLSIALLAVLLSFSLGTLVGALAAVSGPRLDNLVMRVVDACMSFPPIFLVLAVAAMLRPGTAQVVALLGLTSWMSTSRLARGEFLSLKDRDFVAASRATGQKPWILVLRHMLPNALVPLIVEATVTIGGLILAEAALSFFGLGIQPPTPSWGNMIADGWDSLTLGWWVSTFPGIAICWTVAGFNLLGDGLRDRFDPRYRPAS
jgi:peptide/nickel transport system permease protein